MKTTAIPHATKHAKLRTNLIGLGTAVAVVVVLSSLLYLRVAVSANPAEKTPLPVASVTFAVEDGYERTVSYLGLVVAGRKADLGFEIPGMIAGAPPRPGTPVKQGDVLVRLDDSALQSRRNATAADLEQARVELELAQLKARRQGDLIKTGAVSKDVYDETRLRALSLASRVDAESARLASIDIELEKSSLVAPYDGVVADRYVQQGAVVNPGVPVVRLLESAGLESHIGVSAERVGQLALGTLYTLNLRDQPLRAKLLSIRPDVDPITRTITAVFALPAGTDALDGEPITLELEETVPESGGWLPIAALLEGGRGVWTVLTLHPEGDYQRTAREAVEVLDVRADRAFVRGTLASGAQVVASGVHRISPGVLVNAEKVN